MFNKKILNKNFVTDYEIKKIKRKSFILTYYSLLLLFIAYYLLRIIVIYHLLSRTLFYHKYGVQPEITLKRILNWIKSQPQVTYAITMSRTTKKTLISLLFCETNLDKPLAFFKMFFWMSLEKIHPNPSNQYFPL